jgi:hypothetical protein
MNYCNQHSGIPITVRLSAKDSTFLIALANQAQTKAHVYLSELIEAALDCKRRPNAAPNYFQRLAREAAVCAAGVERE